MWPLTSTTEQPATAVPTAGLHVQDSHQEVKETCNGARGATVWVAGKHGSPRLSMASRCFSVGALPAATGAFEAPASGTTRVKLFRTTTRSSTCRVAGFSLLAVGAV